MHVVAFVVVHVARAYVLVDAMLSDSTHRMPRWSLVLMRHLPAAIDDDENRAVMFAVTRVWSRNPVMIARPARPPVRVITAPLPAGTACS